jgi:hypothetical protein
MIFKKIIPLIIGALVWTDLKNGFYNLLLKLFDINVLGVLNEWEFIIVIILLYTIINLLVLDLKSSITFLLKILLFHFYLIYVIFVILIKIVPYIKSLFYYIAKRLKLFGSFKGLIILIIMNFLSWLLLINFDIFVFEKFLYLLSIISVLNVIWIFSWTFDPFNFFEELENQKTNMVVELNSKIDELNMNKKELIKKSKDKKIEYHNFEVRFWIEFLKFIKEVSINKILIVSFTFLFITIVVSIVINFGFVYYVLNNLNEVHLKISSANIDLIDFFILSFRVLFFSNYSKIEFISKLSTYFVLLQSFFGMFLFTLLVLSFSTITTNYGDLRYKKMQNKLQPFIEKISKTKICDSPNDEAI